MGQWPPSHAVILRARRWMTAGLIVSIVGTRVVEGGSSGSVAAEVLPLAWIAVLATVGQALAFASPLIARAFRHRNPANVLVASDALEAFVSVVAVALLVFLPTAEVLVVYLLVASIFPAVADIVEEFYAQQLAQLDTDHALKFNAAIYSALAFIGLVVGMPVGSVLSGHSIVWFVGVNAVLSAGGTLFRLVSSRTVITPAIMEQDVEDFGVLGARTSAGRFVSDLVRTGPASPAVSFLMKVGAATSGVYLYLWIAQAAPWASAMALAVVIGVFGVGATIGPQLAPLLRRRFSTLDALLMVYVGMVGVIVAALVAVTVASVASRWIIALVFVFLIAVVSRVNAVLTTTLRQQSFRGRQFVTVMSWSFSLVALGEIVGSWAGLVLGVSTTPQIGLGVYLVAVAAALLTVVRFRRGREASPVARDRDSILV